MTGLELETAAREDIPILSIYLNNGEMASYETPFSGEYAEMARSLGAYGERIKAPEEIAPAIERGIAETEAGVPALLEFVTAKETALSVF